MIKKLLATTALCTISAAFAASAADMQVKAPVYKAPPAAPVYNWTGFYLGGNAGYGWGKSAVNSSSFGLGEVDLRFEESFFSFNAPGTTASGNMKPSGWVGGFQAGYNLQTNRNWVVGLEADYQWSGQKGSAQNNSGSELSIISGRLGIDPAVFGNYSSALTTQSRLESFGTVRGRIGFVPDSMPGLMIFGTGGLAYGTIKTSVSGSAQISGEYFDDTAAPYCGNGSPPEVCAFKASGSYSGSDKKSKVGWVLGGGMEGALMGNWTWKAEYLYMDLGTVSGNMPISGSFAGTSVGYTNRMTDQILRMGINLRM